MSDDPVEQVRKIASRGRMDDMDVQVIFDAADEIERLLRNALKGRHDPASKDRTMNDAELLQAVAETLIHAPEQGEWEWEDHCHGIATYLLARFDMQPKPPRPVGEDEF